MLARSLFWLAVGICFAQAPSSTDTLGAKGRIPVLMISGADTFHNWRATTPQTRTLLEGSGKFDVRVVEDVHILESSQALARYRVLFFNQQVDASSPAMRDNLKAFLERGGGLVALHWAVDNFHDWPEFADVLGRAWQEGTSKEEHGAFGVRIVNREHPITLGMADFTTSGEEAIHYRLRGGSRIEILATARTQETKEDAPVMFTHSVGRGRVFFSPFGHSAVGRENPGVKEMILRATEWAAGMRK